MSEFVENKPKRGRPKKTPNGETWNFKTWYENNKDELAKTRKDRYANNPDYRDSVLKRNKKYRDKQRQLTPRRPPPEFKPRKTMLIEITVADKVVGYPAYHISSLSTRLGKSIPTIYGWERNGILPRTPFLVGNDLKKERLYTSDMIDVVAEVLLKRNGKVSVKDHSFFDEIRSKWMSLGVISPDRGVYHGET